MHVTPPGGATNKVIAINEPKFIGRDSDAVDTDTEKTGKIVMQVIPATHRMEVHMPMLAADGSRVGTICTVYLWEDERQAADYFVRSLAMRDELRPLIPSYESLIRPSQARRSGSAGSRRRPSGPCRFRPEQRV